MTELWPKAHIFGGIWTGIPEAPKFVKTAQHGILFTNTLQGCRLSEIFSKIKLMPDFMAQNHSFEHFDHILTLNEHILENPDFPGKIGPGHF